MKRIISLVLFLIILISCNSRKKNTNKDESIRNDEIESAETIIRVDVVQETEKLDTIKNPQDNTVFKMRNFYDSYPKTLTKLEYKFFQTDIGSFNCSDIEQFYDYDGKLNTEGLFEIDSILSRELFGNNESENYGSFVGSYLYSLEKPILNLYPITVIRMFGVAESPILLVLFDENGKYVNSIEVADAYGEIGGCLNSFFVNDSTLIKEYELGNLDENENYYTTKSKEKVIIHRDGTLSVIEDIKTKESHK